MTLLITSFAAIITTIIWYKKAPDNTMQLGTLALMYWGVALMWLVDAIVEYSEVGALFFDQAPAGMLNDSYLGFSVVALGLRVEFLSLIHI